MTGAVGAGLALLAGGAPLALDTGIPWAVGLVVVALLAVVGGVSTAWEVLRVGSAVLLLGWVVTVIAVGSGPVVAVAITSGVALRLWAGVPELVRVGRAGLPDLGAEVVGGAAAAGLVVLASRRADDLAPAGLLLAVGALGLLAVVGVRRWRDPDRQ